MENVNEKAETLKMISTLRTIPRRLFTKLLKEGAFATYFVPGAKRKSCEEVVIGVTILRFNKSVNINGLLYRAISMVLNVVKRMNKFGRMQNIHGLLIAGLGMSTTKYNRPTAYDCDPPSYYEQCVSKIVWLVDSLIIVYIEWSETQKQYYICNYIFVSTANPMEEYRLWKDSYFGKPNF